MATLAAHLWAGCAYDARLSFEHPRTSDPDGRDVVFDVGSRLHPGEWRPWMLDYIDVILDTVARPDYRLLDLIPNRERLWLFGRSVATCVRATLVSEVSGPI